MITAGITAAIAGLLSLLGIKPGAYLVGVAIGVKILVVGVGVVLGARVMRRRASPVAAPTPSLEGAEAERTDPSKPNP